MMEIVFKPSETPNTRILNGNLKSALVKREYGQIPNNKPKKRVSIAIQNFQDMVLNPTMQQISCDMDIINADLSSKFNNFNTNKNFKDNYKRSSVNTFNRINNLNGKMIIKPEQNQSKILQQNQKLEKSDENSSPRKIKLEKNTSYSIHTKENFKPIYITPNGQLEFIEETKKIFKKPSYNNFMEKIDKP